MNSNEISKGRHNKQVRQEKSFDILIANDLFYFPPPIKSIVSFQCKVVRHIHNVLIPELFLFKNVSKQVKCQNEARD